MDLLGPDITELHLAALAVVRFDEEVVAEEVAAVLGITTERAEALLRDLVTAGLLVSEEAEEDEE